MIFVFCHIPLGKWIHEVGSLLWGFNDYESWIQSLIALYNGWSDVVWKRNRPIPRESLAILKGLALMVYVFARSRFAQTGRHLGWSKNIKKTGYPQLRFSVGLSSFFLEQNLRCMSIPIFRKKSNGTHAYLQSSRQVVGTTYTWLVPRCHSLFLPCKSPAASLLPSSSHRLVQYWRPLEVIHKIHKDVLTY